MSSQKKLIEDILSSYNTILEKKLMFEVTDIYPNIKFENIGQGNPVEDDISTTLLNDVQTAAKKAGVNVTVTTAISGHDGDTRHETGNAVDIAKINGIGSGSATNETNGNVKFRKLGNKLKDALVSMGYVWNTEIGNPKTVLWQTNTGGNHFNHVHVSNTDGIDNDSTDNKKNKDSFLRKMATGLLNRIGINESFNYPKKLDEDIKRIKKLL